MEVFKMKEDRRKSYPLHDHGTLSRFVNANFDSPSLRNSSPSDFSHSSMPTTAELLAWMSWWTDCACSHTGNRPRNFVSCSTCMTSTVGQSSDTYYLSFTLHLSLYSSKISPRACLNTDLILIRVRNHCQKCAMTKGQWKYEGLFVSLWSGLDSESALCFAQILIRI